MATLLPSLHRFVFWTPTSHLAFFTRQKPTAHSLADFPTPSLKSCFLSLIASHPFVFVGQEESQDAVGAAASSQVCLFQDPSGLRPPAVATFTDSTQQGTDFLELKKLTRKNPNERNHELRLSVPH